MNPLNILLFAMPGAGEWLIIIFLPIIIFLVIRSILLWYWKVDVVIKNLEEIKSLLKSQNDFLEKRTLGITGAESKEEIERKARLFDESQKKSSE